MREGGADAASEAYLGAPGPEGYTRRGKPNGGIARMVEWKPRIEKGEGPIYQALADALVADIASGKLPPGLRLPTQRELAESLGASVGTVTRAYREAEARGAIDATPGRGTFVRRLPGDRSVVGASLAQDHRLIDLSVAHPQYGQDPDLASALRSVADRVDVQRLLRYQALPHQPRYREAGARWLGECGIALEGGAMAITAGAQHAGFVLLSALSGPGDLIVTDELTYPGFLAAAEHSGRRVRGVPMDAHGMVPEALGEICRRDRPRVLYLIPTLQNPTGILVPEGRRQELARVAEEHDLLVIEDDTLRLLVSGPPPPVTSLIPDRSFFVATLSKAVAGGLRLAFLTSPPRFADAVEAATGATVFMVSPLLLEIATEWIGDGTAMRTVVQKRAEIEGRHALAREILKNRTFLSHPRSYYLWLELGEGWNSPEFEAEARRRGVGVTASRPFAAASSDPPNGVRVCLSAAESRENLQVALRTLGHLVDQPGSRTPGLL